jgi:hypothetical protein
MLDARRGGDRTVVMKHSGKHNETFQGASRGTRPASEFGIADTCIIFETRPLAMPSWTTKGLVLTESRATVSYWDGKTQTRKTRIGRQYRPVVISGPLVEELRARAVGARKRGRGTGRRRKRNATPKSKKG